MFGDLIHLTSSASAACEPRAPLAVEPAQGLRPCVLAKSDAQAPSEFQARLGIPEVPACRYLAWTCAEKAVRLPGSEGACAPPVVGIAKLIPGRQKRGPAPRFTSQINRIRVAAAPT